MISSCTVVHTNIGVMTLVMLVLLILWLLSSSSLPCPDLNCIGLLSYVVVVVLVVSLDSFSKNGAMKPVCWLSQFFSKIYAGWGHMVKLIVLQS